MVDSVEDLIVSIFDDYPMGSHRCDNSIVEKCYDGNLFIAFDVWADISDGGLYVSCINVCSTRMANRSDARHIFWIGTTESGYVETIDRFPNICINWGLLGTLKEQFGPASKETRFFIDCVKARIL